MTASEGAVPETGLNGVFNRLWLPGLLVIQVAIGSFWTLRSGFFADDFVWFRVARQSGLNRALLERSAFGHFIPAFHTTNWIFDHFIGASNWWVGALIILLWHACLTLTVAALAALCGARPLVRISLCCLVAVCPVVTSGLIWWGAALCLITSTTLNVAVFFCFIAAVQRRRFALPGLAITFLAACTFWEKSLTAAPYALIFSAIVLDSGQPLRIRVRNLVWRWRVWLTLGVPAAVYAGLYLRGTYASESAATHPTVGQLIAFVFKGWFLGFWPLVVGFRTSLTGDLSTPVAGIVLGQLAAVGLVALAFRWSDSWRATTSFFVVVFIVNMLVVGTARGTIGTAAIDPRYQFDNMYLLIVAAATACIRSPNSSEHRALRPQSQFSSPVRWSAVGAVGTVLLALQIHASAQILRDSPGPSARNYASNFQRTIRTLPLGAGLVDSVVPVSLVPPQMYPYNRFSNVLTQLSTVRFTTDPAQAWYVRDDGTILPARLSAVLTVAPPMSCVSPSGTAPGWIEAPLPTTLDTGNWTIQLTFTGTPPSSAQLWARAAPGADPYPIHGSPEDITVAPDSSEVMAVNQYLAVSSVLILIPAGEQACVGSVSIGNLEHS